MALSFPKVPSNKICTIFSIMLFAVEISCLTTSSPSHFSKFSRASSKEPIKSACKNTPYPAACEFSILSSATSLPRPQTPTAVFEHLVQYSKGQAELALALASHLSLSNQKAQMFNLAGGINDCIELLDDSLDQLNNVINSKKIINQDDDVQTWLSAAITNQETCVESLTNKHDVYNLASGAKNLSQLISNSLALFMRNSEIGRGRGRGRGSGGRRLLSGKFPAWVSGPERKLLEASIGEIRAHAVVAKDGSGTHKSIREAIAVAASLAGGGRSVIHITAGTYNEYIKIPSKQKNVMLVGDGKGKTIIVGNKNSEAGSSTYDSATVGAMGDGFIARDITFVNSAGPTKHQAVALRVGSDKSVIFGCSIIGYQDTLYTLSKRQFYRDTDIYGTVDFIFGNSVVVFQNCNIYVRKPLSGQKNFITAQGRSDPNQNTGISIHNCKIAAASDLAPVRSKVPTYLGRPWKQYSRTVIMQSFMDDSISSSGWSPWSGSFALKSLYYAEFMNSGPGSSTSGRVNWPGYHSSITSTEAQKFTVAGFIAGNLWLPSTGVSFDSGLIG